MTDKFIKRIEESAVKCNSTKAGALNTKLCKTKTDAETDEWTVAANAHDTQESQIELLDELLRRVRNETTASESDERTRMKAGDSTPPHKILLSHLKTKQSGYRSQDVLKGIHDSDKFITTEQIIRLLIDSNLTCYYCKKWTPVFYKYVRDSRQWTLERLSNAVGHNYDNVAIACLECNMRRRTMYHERYLATKQLRVNKIDHGVPENTSSVKEDK